MKELGGRNRRGGPGSGRPTQCITKTNHDESRGLFVALPLSLPPLTMPFSHFDSEPLFKHDGKILVMSINLPVHPLQEDLSGGRRSHIIQ
jgi:hypothetical protein